MVLDYEKVFKNHDFCDVVMPNGKKRKILKYTQYQNLIGCPLLFMQNLNL